ENGFVQESHNCKCGETHVLLRVQFLRGILFRLSQRALNLLAERLRVRNRLSLRAQADNHGQYVLIGQGEIIEPTVAHTFICTNTLRTKKSSPHRRPLRNPRLPAVRVRVLESLREHRFPPSASSICSPKHCQCG